LGSGTVRSRSFYIKTGYLPLQTIMLPIDYAYRSAETKFGSIGVKIWMRKQF
jgi:ribosomal protein S3